MMRRFLGRRLISALAMVLALAPSAVLANPNCPAGTTMNIVAHEDDDILFLSPDLLHEIQLGRCVRTVFVTAGDGNNGAAYWQGREMGAKAAYEEMTKQAASWTVSDAGIAGRSIPIHTLTGNPRISLIFLRLPDGNMDGSGFPNNANQSLQKLWMGSIPDITTVDGSNHYTRSSLQSLLLSLITGYQPDRLKTQNHFGSYTDGDHSDHHTVAYLVDSVNRQYSGAHVFLGYQGYVINTFEPNVLGTDLTAKQNAFLAYRAHDPLVPSDSYAYDAWVRRQYKVTASPNLAGAATVSASSEDSSTGQTATKAVDGITDGYPMDYTREWATQGGREGSWLQLTWATPQVIEELVLNDRPNLNEQITGGTIAFSDGSSESFDSLDNHGSDVRLRFPRKTVTSLRLDITAVSGTTSNTGLSELKVYGPPHFGPNLALDAVATASSEDVATSQTANKVNDDVVDGYPNDYTKEWVTTGGAAGSWIQLTWNTARTINHIVFHDRPILDEQVTGGTLYFSDGSSVVVGPLNNDGSPTPITFPDRTITWLQFQISSVKATTSNIGLAELKVYGP